MQHSQPGRCPSLGQCIFWGGACLWVCFGPLEGYALWFECLEMVQDGLEEGEFSREIGEFGGDAIDDVSDGSAVRVDGVVVLLW